MAEEDIEKKLKDIPPEERIKKLKEMQEKERVKIEEAEKLIMGEQQEIERQKKNQEQLEMINLPEPKKVDIRKLFTDSDDEDNLESQVNREKPQLTEEELQDMRDYESTMRIQPAEKIYQKVRELKEGIDEKGYMNPTERVELDSIGHALNYKERDIDQGKYVPTSEIIEDFMGTAKSIIRYLRG